MWIRFCRWPGGNWKGLALRHIWKNLSGRSALNRFKASDAPIRTGCTPIRDRFIPKPLRNSEPVAAGVPYGRALYHTVFTIKLGYTHDIIGAAMRPACCVHS